jgi:hypothetical protein
VKDPANEAWGDYNLHARLVGELQTFREALASSVAVTADEEVVGLLPLDSLETLRRAQEGIHGALFEIDAALAKARKRLDELAALAKAAEAVPVAGQAALVVRCREVCGKCEACAPLVWALRFVGPPTVAVGAGFRGGKTLRHEALRILENPCALAALIVDAARGRGVDATELDVAAWEADLRVHAVGHTVFVGTRFHSAHMEVREARRVLQGVMGAALPPGVLVAVWGAG